MAESRLHQQSKGSATVEQDPAQSQVCNDFIVIIIIIVNEYPEAALTASISV